MINTLLSPNAVTALNRIRTLREMTRKTGFQTHQEQFKVLLSLVDADLLDVANALADEPWISGGAR